MASVFKKTYTRPLSELPGEVRMAERKNRQGGVYPVVHWVDGHERKRFAPLTADGTGVLIEAETYTARYRRADGRLVEVSTGCRDKSAAESFLAARLRREELVKGGVLTQGEADMSAAAKMPIEGHVEDFLRDRQSKVSPRHFANLEHNLRRVVGDCGFQTLADVRREAVEAWLDARAANMSAATRNRHRSAVLAFAQWCVKTRRLAANPLMGLERSDEAGNRKRQRRALTIDELGKLLDAARRRPLTDALTVRRGKRKGELTAEVGEATHERLDALGRERALLYATLFATGLRKGELVSLTVGQCILDGERPYLSLRGADAKNGKAAILPLRRDLACAIGQWLAERLKARQRAAYEAGEAIPKALPLDAPLFNVPAALDKIIRRDLDFAGIPRKDAQGRPTVDVHALRHSFATHLSKAGVAPRTAQAAMRHSTINLTMTTYTDATLLPVAEAVESLPALPLAAPRMLPEPAPPVLAPVLALAGGPEGHIAAQNGPEEGGKEGEGDETEKAETPAYTLANRPFGDGVSEGIRTPDLQSHSLSL